MIVADRRIDRDIIKEIRERIENLNLDIKFGISSLKQKDL